jgi:hypothetical protein
MSDEPLLSGTWFIGGLFPSGEEPVFSGTHGFATSRWLRVSVSYFLLRSLST